MGKPHNGFSRVLIQKMDKNKMIKVLEMVAIDMKNDATEFEGKSFNGKTVGTYFGNQGAAIAALANVIREMLKEK